MTSKFRSGTLAVWLEFSFFVESLIDRFSLRNILIENFWETSPSSKGAVIPIQLLRTKFLRPLPTWFQCRFFICQRLLRR